jgi:hypothetical protein
VSNKHTETPNGEFPAIPKEDSKRKPTTHFPQENQVAPACGIPKPAELDQDPGGGYNPDGTYPQT